RRILIATLTSVTKTKNHRHWRFRIHCQLKWLMTPWTGNVGAKAGALFLGEANIKSDSNTTLSFKE
ncbi:hypothetical protein, partial [Ferviditalea candida]|nr:hypothetical protein [Paenibacillaceae bacterium T2]